MVGSNLTRTHVCGIFPWEVAPQPHVPDVTSAKAKRLNPALIYSSISRLTL